MFSLSKIIGTLIEPANILVAILLAALLLRLGSADMALRASRGLLASLLVIVVILTVFPVGQWVLAPLENRYAHEPLPDKVDGILLLTGDEAPGLSAQRGVAIGGWAAQRYIHLAHLAQRYPAARLVVVGNTNHVSPSDKMTTQDIAKDILHAIGVPASRVSYEPLSKNTYWNAVNAKQLVNPKPEEKWIVITMAAHLPRAVLCFQKVGWNVVPSAADYFTDGLYPIRIFGHLQQNLFFLQVASHEYYGLLSYKLIGWTDHFWI